MQGKKVHSSGRQSWFCDSIILATCWDNVLSSGRDPKKKKKKKMRREHKHIFKTEGTGLHSSLYP